MFATEDNAKKGSCCFALPSVLSRSAQLLQMKGLFALFVCRHPIKGNDRYGLVGEASTPQSCVFLSLGLRGALDDFATLPSSSEHQSCSRAVHFAKQTQCHGPQLAPEELGLVLPTWDPLEAMPPAGPGAHITISSCHLQLGSEKALISFHQEVKGCARGLG